ncbi:MAG TPA: histidine phosphatase family protein [Opitutaceae bacterium]
MLLYLVRHTHAVTEEENPVRPLSDRGRADATRIAAFLRAAGACHPAQVWHSPLVRARETAQRFAAGIGGETLLVETSDLLPDDDPSDIAHRLAEYPATHDLALVGHEPHLSALGTLLVRGRKKPIAFALRKGAVVALERDERVHKKSGLPRWRVRWHFSPELLPPALPPPAPAPESPVIVPEI